MRKKKIDAHENFLGAINEIEKTGIDRKIICEGIKEAIENVIKKRYSDETIVETTVDLETGDIFIYVVHNVVSEAEYKDGVLEVTENEAHDEINEVPGAYIDEEKKQLYTPVYLKNFSRLEANKFKSIFTQKLKEAEKANTYSAYCDKVGEIVSGYVEKVDDRYTLINLGRTSVALQDKNKIGDETFKPGELVKVYLSEVTSSTKGPQIIVSRSDKNFLKRLFEEEIHEVYNGTIIINDIAREAGLRSKVSVSTTDINVDPVGSCIGQGGSKIQKICAQINHEKIDIIQYYEYPGLFIAEALKPAEVIGIKLNEEEKKAIAVIKDGQTRVAIGTKGVNARLAVKLTHYSIDIIEQKAAIEQNIEFETMDELKAHEDRIVFEKKRDAILQEQAREDALREEEAKQAALKAEQEKIAEENVNTEDQVQEEVEQETVKETKEVETEKPVEYKPVNVGEQKITLEELEKQIEEEKKKTVKTRPVIKKNKKSEDDESEKELIKEEVKAEPKRYMDIYTQEELDAMDEEEDEEEYDDEDIDYEEYDKYYEDN